MKTRIPLHTTALALVLLALILLPWDSATARPPVSVTSFVATESDFPIWEWRFSNACDEMHADVAYNEDDDEYLVVFDWDLNDSDDHDIMAVTVSADGQAAMSSFSIAYDATYDDSYPAVARDPYGNGYLVVWQRRIGTGDYNIYGSVITSTVGAPFALATWSGDQLYPDVAYATATSRYLVVWEDHYSTWTNAPDIYSASLNNSRTDVQYLSITGHDAPGNQTRPAVVTNGFNYHWLVTWKDSRNSGTTSDDIYGQLLKFLGGTLSLESSQIHIGALSGYAGAPAVGWGQVDPSASAYGEYLVAWPESDDMLAQRIDGQDYSLVGGPITVSDYDSGKYDPAVIYATVSEEWWLVWEDNRDYG
jgi:hypothetical protein